jgi:tRNA A37 threonylcarbamoyladenosine dehydratase
MKSDPTRIQIRDIADCKYDNLINRLRRVKVEFSYQQAEKELLPLQEHQEDDPDKFRVFDNYRLRIVPVLGTMPAILGMAIASYVLCDLADEPYSPFETDYVKSSALNKLYNELLND